MSRTGSSELSLPIRPRFTSRGKSIRRASGGRHAPTPWNILHKRLYRKTLEYSPFLLMPTRPGVGAPQNALFFDRLVGILCRRGEDSREKPTSRPGAALR